MTATLAEAGSRSFLRRIQEAQSRSVVIHTTSGRSYAGILVAADEASVRLEGDSEDYDAPCVLEIDATRVEAIEIITA